MPGNDYTIHSSSRALLTAALKAWERNSLIAATTDRKGRRDRDSRKPGGRPLLTVRRETANDPAYGADDAVDGQRSEQA